MNKGKNSYGFSLLSHISHLMLLAVTKTKKSYSKSHRLWPVQLDPCCHGYKRQNRFFCFRGLTKIITIFPPTAWLSLISLISLFSPSLLLYYLSSHLLFLHLALSHYPTPPYFILACPKFTSSWRLPNLPQISGETFFLLCPLQWNSATDVSSV